METILECSHVGKDFLMGRRSLSVLRDVSFSLERGKRYAIIGPSGSGKSTLMHLMGCMDTPSRGTIRFAGKDISHLPEGERTKLRAREIGFVFQAFHLNPILNVEDNVTIALRLVGASRTDARTQARRWLEKVGLGHRLRHAITELSGGERQRVAIARALVKRPSLILADEPTGNLDSESGRQVLEAFQEAHAGGEATLVIITHNPEVASGSDEQFRMKDGFLQV